MWSVFCDLCVKVYRYSVDIISIFMFGPHTFQNGGCNCNCCSWYSCTVSPCNNCIMLFGRGLNNCHEIWSLKQYCKRTWGMLYTERVVVRTVQRIVLTFPINLSFVLATAIKMQEYDFCHDWIIKAVQMHVSSRIVLKKIILQWNYSVSFYVVTSNYGYDIENLTYYTSL
jgi:hypothetical protein